LSEKRREKEKLYQTRIIIILGVVRFLLLQALAFRGHDESSNSSNKRKFLEMVEWYKKKNPQDASVLGASNNIFLSLCLIKF
jgi:hypothetical protein